MRECDCWIIAASGSQNLKKRRWKLARLQKAKSGLRLFPVGGGILFPELKQQCRTATRSFLYKPSHQQVVISPIQQKPIKLTQLSVTVLQNLLHYSSSMLEIRWWFGFFLYSLVYIFKIFSTTKLLLDVAAKLLKPTNILRDPASTHTHIYTYTYT